MSDAARYIDPQTRETFSLEKPLWRSPSGNPMMVTDLPGIGRDDIDRSARSIWRYRAALPLDIKSPVSLGEGLTPLVPAKLPAGEVDFKLEWFAPTSSFKDRGASVMLSYLRQVGVDAILEDSSGNGGAAIAAYGAAAGVKVRILTPETTQLAKIVQMRAFGAHVQLVSGPRENSQFEAIRQSEQTFYASHNWQAFFLQGTKLLAYELWEDYGFEVPDNIVIPAGAGSNVLGCDLGFTELLRAGQITKLPRLFAVQPQNCSPIHAAFSAGSNGPVPIEVSPTVAEGTAIRSPVRMSAVLGAIRRSKGSTVAVSEDEIISAVGLLARAGFYAEPTSAMAAAAADKLLAGGVIQSGERTVVLLTGSGLKSAAFMMDRFSGE
ncbi:pyridoxal-phosphate dependent enzyme [Pararhizobium sp. DWP1-1-3]|uniref:pyridoxal-phosphate dependent enzyme n=1 Tax=Pararhizobium sp. DWP1-1-3 TaxID=2804652 RepID=UPI003CF22DA0